MQARSNIIIISFIYIFHVFSCINIFAENDACALLINSYNSSFPINFDEINGIKSVFNISEVILDVESFNSKRFIYKKYKNLKQGKSAAQKVMSILNGTKSKELKVKTESLNQYKFDFSELKKNNISKRSLLEHSIKLNTQNSFFRQYKYLILIVLLFILIQSLLIFYLFRKIYKRKKTESALTRKVDEYLRLNEEYSILNNEHENTNEKISECEEKYRLLFDNITEGFALHEIVLDENKNPVDFIYRDVTTEILRRIGLKYDEIINKKAKELFPETELSKIEKFGKVALTGKPESFIKHSSAIKKHYSTHIFSPKKVFFAALFSDITKIIEARNKVQDTLNKVQIKKLMFQTIFNNAPSIILLLNEECKILQMNQSGLSIIEKTNQEIVNLGPGDVFNCVNAISSPLGCGTHSNCSLCKVQNTVIDTINNKTIHNKIESELFVLDKKGYSAKITVLVSTSTINDGENEKYLVTMEDVTHIKQTEKDLLQINKRFQGLEDIIHYNAESINDLLDFTLKKVIEYTQSEIGTVYHYDEKQNIFYLNNWSDEISLIVKANSKSDLNRLDCINRAARSKKAVIINDPDTIYPFQITDDNTDNLLKGTSKNLFLTF